MWHFFAQVHPKFWHTDVIYDYFMLIAEPCRFLNLEVASRDYLDQSNVFFSYVQNSLSYFVALKYCANKSNTWGLS